MMNWSIESGAMQCMPKPGCLSRRRRPSSSRATITIASRRHSSLFARCSLFFLLLLASGRSGAGCDHSDQEGVFTFAPATPSLVVHGTIIAQASLSESRLAAKPCITLNCCALSFTALSRRRRRNGRSCACTRTHARTTTLVVPRSFASFWIRIEAAPKCRRKLPPPHIHRA